MIRCTAIMPVYNAAPYLEQALSSLLVQMAPDDELLAIDDGSTDESQRILAEQGDPRLRSFRQQNQGAAAARNRGLDEAKGQFIAFLDADDLALPGRLDLPLARFQERPALALVAGKAQVIDEAGGVLRSMGEPASHGALFWKTLFNSPFTASTVTVRAEAAKGLRFDSAVVPAEDYCYFADMLDRGEGEILDATLARYRVHGAQVTKRREDALREGGNLVSARKLRERLGVVLPDEMVFLLRHLEAFGIGRLEREHMPLAAPAQATLWQLFTQVKRLGVLGEEAQARIEADLQEKLFP